MTSVDDKFKELCGSMTPQQLNELLRQLSPASAASLSATTSQFRTTTIDSLSKASQMPHLDAVNRITKWRASYKQLYPFLVNFFPDIAEWWDGYVADFEVVSSLGDIELTLVNSQNSEHERVVLRFTLERLRPEESKS